MPGQLLLIGFFYFPARAATHILSGRLKAGRQNLALEIEVRILSRQL